MPKSAKILVVDDDRVTCAALSGMLRGGGYTVVSAFDAMSGFSAAMRERPALVVIDISMPAGGGFSVLERMKTFPALATTPSIVVTATDDVSLRDRANALGSVAFLLKPIHAEELLRFVGEAVGA